MPLTLAILRQEGWVQAWEPGGRRLANRAFYFSRRWRDARSLLAGPPRKEPIRWWDEAAPSTAAPDMAAPFDDPALLHPALDPSVRGRLDGLIETFVCGWLRERLVRPQGFGKEPLFQRMRGAYAPVIEMSTEATRTFGFFVRSGVLLAHRLDLAANTHADPSLYRRYGEDVLTLLRRMAHSDKDETTDVETLIGEC